MTPLEMQLRGYRLTTAEILYRMPDHPGLLQSYVWQEFDKTPDFPVLKHFLEFWERRLDGRLHSVRVACVEVVRPAEMRLVGDLIHLH